MHAPVHKKGFSEEQLSYLAGLVSKLNLHEAFSGDAAGQDGDVNGAEKVHGTLLEDLCKEEVAKYNLHPLDLRARIERWTDQNEIATGLDQFLLRHWGFFNVTPNSPGYMVRLRIPACKLRGDQMIALADIAEKYAGGYAHVTTRGNIQMREIEPKDVLNVLYDLQQAGLSCHGSGADSARNMTASPTSGFDPVELIDMAPYAIRLSDRVLHTRDLQGLPRKFNISFDGGGLISAVSDSNDICFQAVEIAAGDHEVDPGIYCRIMLGGISGHKDLARDTGYLCAPEQSVLAGIAMLYVFVEYADRTNRKKARLKYLLDGKGFDWFMQKTRQKLVELEAGFDLVFLDADYDKPRHPVDRQAHIGIHKQSEPGKSFVGIALEMGRLSPEQMRIIGACALQNGQNDIRLTVWQNLIIPGIGEGDLPTVVDQLHSHHMPTLATAFAAGAIACTGRWGCKFGLAYTKQDGTQLIQHLESRFSLDRPINIHLTGCPNSCAQHYIGDIGLLGATMADGAEGYHIVVGGGSDTDKGIGRYLHGPVAASQINEIVETMIANYLAKRAHKESFLEYVRGLSDDQLPVLLDGYERAA